jgi:hypothetical protein
MLYFSSGSRGLGFVGSCLRIFYYLLYTMLLLAVFDHDSCRAHHPSLQLEPNALLLQRPSPLNITDFTFSSTQNMSLLHDHCPLV